MPSARGYNRWNEAEQKALIDALLERGRAGDWEAIKADPKYKEDLK